MKPTLFVLKMPFEDGLNTSWFCTHCALIEAALSINPHWENEIVVRRIGFKKPRKELVELLGESNQWLPVLVLENQLTILDPIEITQYLADKYGGAAPHP